jgi:ParB family chromosome partitioning protein
VRRDLFSDDENAGYIADADLLQRLVGQKLDAAVEEVRAEGWAWVETRVERDLLDLNRYGKLQPVHRPYTEDEQRQIDALTAQRDELAEKLDALSEDDENAYEEADRLDLEIERANAAIAAIERAAVLWDTAQMAEAGAYVIVGSQGELTFERGLVRRVNGAALDAAGATVRGMPAAEVPDRTDTKAPKVKPVHSWKLCQRLTAHRAAAIHAELVAQPTVALAALLRHRIPQALPEHYGHTSAPDYLALSVENNRDRLLRTADDLAPLADPAGPGHDAARSRGLLHRYAARRHRGRGKAACHQCARGRERPQLEVRKHAIPRELIPSRSVTVSSYIICRERCCTVAGTVDHAPLSSDAGGPNKTINL